jgi:hypothetical protein
VERARGLVRGELERQGWSAGEGPVHRALRGAVPLRLVRRVLGERKAERRGRIEREERERRTRIEVRAGDALWCLDATQLGREVGAALGPAVQAEVVRDVASGRTLGVSVGRAATAAEVIALLEQVAKERGGLPLVLVTDNGAAYSSEGFEAWLAEREVVHLRSLPGTPQHNPWAERGMWELKTEAGLGLRGVGGGSSRTKGGLVDAAKACARLMAAVGRLDGERPRRSRGWRTAARMDRDLRPWNRLTRLSSLWKKVRGALARAALGSKPGRARRLAEREAILVTLERCGLLKRNRGGCQPPQREAAGVS